MSFAPFLTRWSHSASLRNFLYRKMRGFQASWMTSPVHSICRCHRRMSSLGALCYCNRTKPFGPSMVHEQAVASSCIPPSLLVSSARRTGVRLGEPATPFMPHDYLM